MPLTNPRIFGLKITNKLQDSENKQEVLRNLRLPEPDLDIIRGSVDAGASREDFINFSRLSQPIFQTLDRYYEDAKVYERVLDDRASISSILRGNLKISGKLDGIAIRYRYLDSKKFNVPNTDVDTTNDIITLIGHGLFTNDEIIYISGSTSIGGLVDYTIYFVIKESDDTFKLKPTTSGTAINLTSQGAGNHQFITVGKVKIADISTSRVSAWSSSDPDASSINLTTQEKARISYGGQVSILSAGGGFANLIFGTQYTGVQGVSGKPRLQTTQIPLEREFRAEIPTHKITIRTDSANREVYAMKGIPLIFEGQFRTLRPRIRVFKSTTNPLQVTVKNMGDILPSWKIKEVNNPDAFLNFVEPSLINNTYSIITFISGSSKERFIQFYYPSDNIIWVDLISAGIRTLPTAKLGNLRFLRLENNKIETLPDLTQFATETVPATSTTNIKFTYLNLRRNPLHLSEIITEQKLNAAVLNKIPQNVNTLILGSTYYGSVSDDSNLTASDYSDWYTPNTESRTHPTSGLPIDTQNANASIIYQRFKNLKTLIWNRYSNRQFFHSDSDDLRAHIPNIPGTICERYEVYRNSFQAIAGGSPLSSTSNAILNNKGRSISNIQNAGSGYSVASNLATTGGSGTGMTVEILSVDGGGAITGIKIKTLQSGYLKGDVLTVVQSGSGGNGRIILGPNDNGKSYLTDAPANSEDTDEKTIKTCTKLKRLILSRNYHLTDESFSIASPEINMVKISFTNLPIPDLRNKSELQTFEANHSRNVGHIAYEDESGNKIYKFNNCDKLRTIHISNSSNLSTGQGTSPNGGLHGPFPEQFTNPELRVIRFENTRIRGGIPGDNDSDPTFPNSLFKKTPLLEEIRIRSSQLRPTGIAAEVFAYTPLLRFLRIHSFENMTGKLPNIGSCPSLYYLDLRFNAFDGPVYSLSSNENLEEVLLNTNQLEGDIPGYDNLPKLRVLRLNDNNFTGMNKFNLPKVTQIRCHMNNMTGTIPTFADCPKLRFLTLYSNFFSNYTSGAIAQNYSLRLADFSNNSLGQTALNNIVNDLYENFEASGSSRSVIVNLRNQNGGVVPGDQVKEKIDELKKVGWQVLTD